MEVGKSTCHFFAPSMLQARKCTNESLTSLPRRIIEKCATVMKGQCSIKFEESRSVFTLDIPAKPFGSTTKVKTSIDVKNFRLPPETWGFCIDDSKIQQKLMVSRYIYILYI